MARDLEIVRNHKSNTKRYNLVGCSIGKQETNQNRFGDDCPKTVKYFCFSFLYQVCEKIYNIFNNDYQLFYCKDLICLVFIRQM